MLENARNVDSIGAGHTVFTVGAGNVLHREELAGDVVVEEFLFLFGERLQRAIGQQIVLEVLHIGHSREHGIDARGRAGIAEGPRGDAVFGVALLELVGHELRHVGESSAEQRLHHGGRNAALLQFAVEIAGIGVAFVDFVGVVPVEVVEFNHHEIPLVFVVPRKERVEHGDVAVVGESEVANASGLALFGQIVEHSIVDIALAEGFHSAAADAVEQVEVDVIDLQLLERIFIHLDAALARLRFGREVRELRGHEVFAALVAAQGDARAVFRHSLTIGRAGVEIVHTVFDGVIDQSVHHFLVDGFLAFAGGLAGDGRQSHHAVAQERHFARVRYFAIGHLAHGRLHLIFVFCLDGSFNLVFASHHRGCRGDGSCSEQFQELAA